MNKTISCGNMTDEPKVTTTSTGKKKAEFTLALNRMNDGADFPRFVAWEKNAENIEKWCHKGTKLLVEGHIQTGSYDGKNGKVYTTDIIVERFEFVGKKQEPAEGIGKNESEEFMKIPEGVGEEIPFA
jgi:single-strand DNA-binding protein